MPDKTDWLMAPVMAGVCQYVWLVSGAVDLVDVARMNDALVVRGENERRARAVAERTGR